jgi:hypothetical protein
MLPKLKNCLDIVLKQPGIYPTSEIVKLDPIIHPGKIRIYEDWQVRINVNI